MTDSDFTFGTDADGNETVEALHPDTGVRNPFRVFSHPGLINQGMPFDVRQLPEPALRQIAKAIVSFAYFEAIPSPESLLEHMAHVYEDEDEERTPEHMARLIRRMQNLHTLWGFRRDFEPGMIFQLWLRTDQPLRFPDRPMPRSETPMKEVVHWLIQQDVRFMIAKATVSDATAKEIAEQMIVVRTDEGTQSFDDALKRWGHDPKMASAIMEAMEQHVKNGGNVAEEDEEKWN